MLLLELSLILAVSTMPPRMDGLILKQAQASQQQRSRKLRRLPLFIILFLTLY
jgi:hypothetical protein